MNTYIKKLWYYTYIFCVVIHMSLCPLFCFVLLTLYFLCRLGTVLKHGKTQNEISCDITESIYSIILMELIPN